MLLSLSIRDVVLIDTLDLEFFPGLCVLTGETGAGKSILLDSLGLALGARADSNLVRAGAAQATVAAAFEAPKGHPAIAMLRDQGIETDGAIVLRRVLSADGRSRAFVNDQPASVGLLRRLGESLVEIQGHFDQQGLLNPAGHRAVLDNFGGHGSLSGECRTAHRAWRAAASALADAEAAAEEARADEDLLRHAHEELDALAPELGEEKALAERRSALMHREKLIAALSDAHARLAAEDSPEDTLRAAQARLEKTVEFAGGTFDVAIQALERAALEVGEATRLLANLGSEIEGEPERLERVDDRLFALREIARKHRVEVDGLPALRDEIAAKLAAIDDYGGAIARLAATLADARDAYLTAAEALSKSRRAAAKALDEAVTAELGPLKLEKARFETAIEPLAEGDWGEDGIESVSFLVATNPGTAPGPLARIASAGELSRFTLALKVVAARTVSMPTLVFDEVDSGIGGATAAAVGDRLARLGHELQVLVVTHSPQVAARGGHHWRVHKSAPGDGKGGGSAVVTSVDELDPPERREEIARMLSGAEITDEARAAADSLIAGAAQ